MWTAFKASVTVKNVLGLGESHMIERKSLISNPMAGKLHFNELFKWPFWRLNFACLLELLNVDGSPPVLNSTDGASFVKTHTRLGLTAVTSGYKEPGSWVPRVALRRRTSAQSFDAFFLSHCYLQPRPQLQRAGCHSFLYLFSLSGCCNFLPLFFLSLPQWKDLY